MFPEAEFILANGRQLENGLPWPVYDNSFVYLMVFFVSSFFIARLPDSIQFALLNTYGYSGKNIKK